MGLTVNEEKLPFHIGDYYREDLNGYKCPRKGPSL
jgi:hypothetical protein